MPMKPVDKKIYLASKSPRRRELLRQIGIDFELLLLRADGPRGADVTEEVLSGEAPLDYVARVAREKAAFGFNLVQRRHLKPRAVLTADTTVTIDGHILGKPADRNEAAAMLEQLSGARIHHQLLTDFLPGQRNTLNVQDGEKIQTLFFDQKNVELPVK